MGNHHGAIFITMPPFHTRWRPRHRLSTNKRQKLSQVTQRDYARANFSVESHPEKLTHWDPLLPFGIVPNPRNTNNPLSQHSDNSRADPDKSTGGGGEVEPGNRMELTQSSSHKKNFNNYLQMEASRNTQLFKQNSMGRSSMWVGNINFKNLYTP